MAGGVCSIAKFQSTHPVRGATDRLIPIMAVHIISIHAPREGCDCRMGEL